ncbi:sensor histidine kinase [Actinotalea sp. K2]|uniref:sensor histidine kinase n=1 Tax=Actinotalea sp. K2 TaxID=2939438 RepID=UPI0020175E87|nr:histidine kinase [Actinotalea sp. K2]MCL3861398.1 histidine kinase [Actinotalea sp. K2]
MQRSRYVEMWAAACLVVVCLLVAVVEGSGVAAVGTPLILGTWLVAFVTYLVGVAVVSVRSTPRSVRGRLVLVAVPVVAGAVVVLLSPNRGGMSAILLVIVAASAALHLSVRATLAVVALNSAVVVAASSAAGPLVTTPSPWGEVVLVGVLYALLQMASASMVWSQERVSEALGQVTVAHVELRSTSALLAQSSQAQERLRISRELHDVLGHQLTALALELEIATHRTEGPGREHVVRARALAKELLGDVRSVVGTERAQPFDLRTALAEVVGDIPYPTVHLDVDPDLDLDDARATALVRAVQEIVTNAIRHAQAENLWVTLNRAEDGDVHLETQDDGVGGAPVVVGNGLRGLQERVAALGGQVELDGSSGFRVNAVLPRRAAVPT